VDLDLAQVAVPTAQAAPIALVVNELICNALKHAFPPGRGGRLTVSIRRLEDAFQIVVGDDGIGLPPGQDPGFGQTIIQLLCRQLQAHCVVENAQPGVLTFVNIPDRYIA
jgi:two-component sensor histidine kinase